jgi:hypothetical protein
MKESSGGDEFKYDVFDIARIFVNAPMYPHSTQQLYIYIYVYIYIYSPYSLVFSLELFVLLQR